MYIHENIQLQLLRMSFMAKCHRLIYGLKKYNVFFHLVHTVCHAGFFVKPKLLQGAMV